VLALYGSKVFTHTIDVLTFGFHFTLHADVNTVCFTDETGHFIWK